MLKSKNLVLYEIIGLLAIFTIIYFVAVNRISYAFTYDAETELYNQKISLIKKASENYASKNLEMFTEEETIYVTVQDLVDEGFYLADDESGKVQDPTSDVKTLNALKIRLSYKDGKISAKVLT